MTETQARDSDKYKVLIVDDEPDVLAVSRLSLKGTKHAGRGIELMAASSGTEALEILRAHPDIAVILLDVVMETDSAGLDCCRAIRGEIGNRFVRILLRTGQPGVAPERQTIDENDIDGYLPKAEITATKLYSAVRTALRAHDEIVELDRHRRYLAALHECVAGLRSFAPLQETLRRVLDTVLVICPSPLAVLHLETFEAEGNPRRFFLHGSSGAPSEIVGAEAVRAAVTAAAAARPLEAGVLCGGFVVPLEVHRELGHGFVYVQEANPDQLVRRILPMLAAHAANALYSSIAEAMLRTQKGPLFDAMAI